MKLFLVSFAYMLFATSAFSQKASEKVVINTPGVQCENCKIKIENSLSHEYGVTSVKADFKKHTVTIVFIKDRTNIENLKAAIANIGYDADDVTAEPDAQKRLPKSCLHPLPPKK